MEITLTYAAPKHFKWLKDRDTHISETALKTKISNKEIIVAQSENKIYGWLRFGMFWDNIPFMNMLFVDEVHRSKGIGNALVQYWETEMKKRRHIIIMTSSQSNEDAQHFYRKLGYDDAGFLTLPNEPLEILFIKRL